ncbi:MAG: hypothetical protein UV05_C0037G0004 [candidate division CPR1 bacterium GW2011_GWA2_42_17]|uniref:General secretion pathway protein G n=1 Tax=candidate division CPR1 bacterium GW2011_GWA2_42_17 TaxID=1618341 RepID=A0A0G0Z1T8_9BACT|nr:MAG: hypothetical protein UV05_C0037G0004 [candidate division CPR1 bacterium GW2011_GWA2_42_17]
MKSLTLNKKGFTLIELLVVLLIIGLLATISVVALGTARAKGRDTRRLTDVKGIQNALELYFLDSNAYPVVASATVLGVPASTGRLDNGGFVASTGNPTGSPVYMVKVPTNPTPNGASYTYTSTAADNVTACTSSPCASYTLTFNLESGAGGYTSGAHTATPPDVVQ